MTDCVNDDLLQLVTSLVADFCGVTVNQVKPETTLVGDLGVDGDDAGDLLATLRDALSINFDELDFSAHFGNEGLPPWFLFTWIKYIITSGTPEQKAGLIPIRISDIVKAAQTKKWHRTQR